MAEAGTEYTCLLALERADATRLRRQVRLECDHQLVVTLPAGRPGTRLACPTCADRPQAA